MRTLLPFIAQAYVLVGQAHKPSSAVMLLSTFIDQCRNQPVDRGKKAFCAWLVSILEYNSKDNDQQLTQCPCVYARMPFLSEAIA
jgi:hypothetical protein